MPTTIPKEYLDIESKITPALLQLVVDNPELWEGKYDPVMRVASFVYIGEGATVGFRVSDIFMDDCSFRVGLWEIINKVD